VFPVEWGIFAFSSIIIVTNFSERRLEADVLWGRMQGTLAAASSSPLEPWRVEMALLVEGAPRLTSARVQLKWENALLARSLLDAERSM